MEDRFRFRLYDKEKGLMLYEDSEILRTEKVYEYEELWWANVAFPIKAISRFFDYNSEERFVLQQCTGLKDKNGKLIYEGDIIKYTDCEGKETIGSLVIDRFNLLTFTNMITCDFCEDWADVVKAVFFTGNSTIEVIGNIYENKELLKELK